MSMRWQMLYMDEVNQLKWENAALKVDEVYKDVLGV